MTVDAGGYRQPSSPAPVSGPGALSQRTDGGPADQQAMRALPNAAYGENAEFQAIQAGAPMMEDPGMPMPPGIDAPTMRPDEPITAGADMGAGPGSEVLPSLQQEVKQDMEALRRYLPLLERRANEPGVPQAFRTFVRYLKGYGTQ